MRELLYENRSVHRRVNLSQRRVYSVPRCSFFSILQKMIGRFWYQLMLTKLVGRTEIYIFEIWVTDYKLV